jgi:hypothetical protein
LENKDQAVARDLLHYLVMLRFVPRPPQPKPLAGLTLNLLNKQKKAIWSGGNQGKARD